MIFIASGASALAVGILLGISHRRALAIESEVVIPNLDSWRRYERTMTLAAFNPWVTLLPHWRVYYAEKPTDISYASPSVSVDLFGRVVDWSSKEVGMGLAERRYIASY